MTTALVPCPGCATRYDLSRRAPGKRVRCPKCQGVLVVPEPTEESAPETTASSRLRRARGPTCRAHPRTLAVGERCVACRSHLCDECRAPQPLDHLCTTCVEDKDLGGAVAIDFGPLATPRRALRALFSALPKIMVWNAASLVGTSLVFGIPAWLGILVFKAVPVESWQADVIAGLVLGCLLMWPAVHYLLLVPSGCAVFLDQALRGTRRGVGAALVEAWRRALRNAGSLFGVITAMALILLPFATLVLGCAYLLFGTGDQGKLVAILLLLAALPLVTLPVVTGLGLAVPVVILEERPAAAALGRAWELARPQLHILVFLVVGYFLFQAVFTSLLARLTAIHGLPPVTFALVYLTDMVWPAILVTSYHGLVAAQLAIPGRK